MLNRHEHKTLMLIFSLALVCLATLPQNVTAQTTTITNLQYPSQVALQNGIAQATVLFTVDFSGLPSGNYLIIGILFGLNYATGSATSTPDACAPLTGTTYANTAACITSPHSNSGTESISFTLTFNLTQEYNLVAFAHMVDTSLTVINGSTSRQPFTISVTAETVPTNSQTSSQTVSANPQSSSLDIAVGLAIIALPFIAVIGIIVFLIRRKKTQGAPIPTPEWGTVPMPPPPVPGGTRFCAACGARLNATAKFCVKCGARQS